MIQNKLLLLITISGFMISGNLPLQAQNLPDQQSPDLIQSQELINLQRAKNLARQAAEKENGGLGKYRAESAMHGPVTEANYEEIEDGVWLFTIRGREVDSEEFTIKTVVRVDQEGNVTVESNEEIE